MKYDIFDRVTKHIVRSGLDHKAAYRIADRMDLAYGAVRYVVMPSELVKSHTSHTFAVGSL